MRLRGLRRLGDRFAVPVPPPGAAGPDGVIARGTRRRLEHPDRAAGSGIPDHHRQSWQSPRRRIRGQDPPVLRRPHARSSVLDPARCASARGQVKQPRAPRLVARWRGNRAGRRQCRGGAPGQNERRVTCAGTAAPFLARRLVSRRTPLPGVRAPLHRHQQVRRCRCRPPAIRAWGVVTRSPVCGVGALRRIQPGQSRPRRPNRW